MSDLDDYLLHQRDAIEGRFFQLLRIPSVSADSHYAAHVREAAEFLVNRFRAMGLESHLIPTKGHPIVLAESPPVPGAPIALVYGHYDVQPPDPLNEWITPPFEPTVRDGAVYARGATDDKGQMLTHVESVAALLATQGKLPLQVKFLIEGEEEVGSEHLAPFIQSHRDRLACDVVVISDSSQFASGIPAVTYGLRGIAYYELRVTGPKQDLHSGVFGGAVTNPINALSRILNSLVDDQGQIQIQGFYDDVVPLTPFERDSFAKLPFDEAAFAGRIGVEQLAGEAGYSTLERRWARPTCDINGIWGGYQGEGAKTVLPARAAAKFSFRLVPHQDPAKITELVRNHIRRVCPPGVQYELIDHHGGPPVVFPLESRYMKAATAALEHGFGAPGVFIREGGSIHIVSHLARELDAEVLLLGWGLDDDNPHSPNEKFSLADFHRGIRASAQLWRELVASAT